MYWIEDVTHFKTQNSTIWIICNMSLKATVVEFSLPIFFLASLFASFP